MTTEADIDRLLVGHEDEHLEFKHRAQHFDLDELVKYCVALANEGGGRLVLGVSDKPPRRVLGTHALRDPELPHRVLQRIHLRVEFEEVQHRDGRVVVVNIPARPVGQPIHDGGKYLVRAGESVVPMTPAQLKRIFEEAEPDYSATLVTKATLLDLAQAAVQRFRELWARKSRRQEFLEGDPQAALEDAELLVDGVPTVAALVLLGTRGALGRHLAQAEIIYEFRDSLDDQGPTRRSEFRDPFLLSVDQLWLSVNAFNREEQLEDGFFRWTIPMFREEVVREAVLNAVAHRDYRSQASVFIRHSPNEMHISSPGGFPPTVTAENILSKSVPRNRRLAEALGRCGLVERAGSGVDLMFRSALNDGKPTPDYSETSPDEVVVRLRGQVQHPAFVRFLAEVSKERGRGFGVADLLLLDQIQREVPLDHRQQHQARELEKQGVLEAHRKGRKRKWLLASRFYSLAGKSGEYTRLRGLDRGEHELLLLKHLRTFGPSSMAQLSAVIPSLGRKGVRRVLTGLRSTGQIALEGAKRGSKWRLASPVSPEKSSSSAASSEAGRGQKRGQNDE